MAAALATGCRQRDWQTRYSSALTEFRNGNSDAALSLIADLPDKPGKHDPIWYWRARILRAQIFLRQNQPAQALSYLSAFPAKLPDEITAKQDVFAGMALCQTGKTAEAQKRFAVADSIISSTTPGLRADLLYARADCISDDHPEQAMQLFSQAAALAHGNDNYLEARALAYRGYLLMQANYCDQAMDVFNQALRSVNSPYTKQTLLGNKGSCSQDLGEWIASGEYLTEAIAISAQMKDAQADHVLWLIDLGRQRASQAEYEDAQKLYEEGLVAARNANRSDLIARALFGSAMVAIKTENLSLAKQRLAAADELNLSKENRVYSAADKAQIASLEGDQSTAERLYMGVLSSDARGPVKWFAQTSLAQIYLKENRPKEAEQMFKSAIAWSEQGFYSVTGERFRISILDEVPYYYDSYVSFLISQGRSLEALSVSERGRSRTLAEARKIHPAGTPLNLRAIQQNLGRHSHQIVLAYWLTEKQSYLWLISATQFKTFTLAPEMDIVREIEAYNQTTLDQSESETAHGQNLFKMLVAPAAKYIPRNARVTIVPHRRLHRLNFETLITDGDNPHFWVEDVCIQNTSFLAGLEKPDDGWPAYPKQLLLMGDPVQATKEFPGLGHAKEEMKAVAGRFNQSAESIYSQANATPEAYGASKPGQFRFLHFVTHGTANDLNPLESAIILSPGKDGFKLYARDIIKTAIHPELVTISSCYGAGTRQYAGEGLVGLSWAFLRAGAHNVIGALWETDDQANVKLMDTFYTAMSKKDDPAGALRTAKLALLHSDSFWKRPYYWAALQLYSSN
ncbi:MAG TPA: CHAT domain-containing protein [Candidatus Angelobacter sp.]|nr:CHAT domain-containing protein [Candidatus Angelobacter sp.]